MPSTVRRGTAFLIVEAVEILEGDFCHLLPGRQEAPQRERQPGFPVLHDGILLPLTEENPHDLDAPLLLFHPELGLRQPEGFADPRGAEVQDADQGPVPLAESIPAWPCSSIPPPFSITRRTVSGE